MEQKSRYKKGYLYQWIDLSDVEPRPELEERCTEETLQEALKDLPNTFVKEIRLREEEQDVPRHMEVVVEERGPGARVTTVRVFLPFVWNGRYLGCLGGGCWTQMIYRVMGEHNRIAMPFNALMNGFAAADTDGGTPGNPFTWGLDAGSGEVDFELIHNLSWRAASHMTKIAKAVIRAAYGTEAAYSYLQGASNGGRMALSEAQINPEEYDGIWSVDPAINWSELFSSFLWPVTVMNTEGHIVSWKKFNWLHREAIRQAEGDWGFNPSLRSVALDPADYIGTDMDGELFTEEDARVVALIRKGNCDLDGRPVWYGYRPETHFFTNSPISGQGSLVLVKGQDGRDELAMNSLLDCDLGWVTRKEKTAVEELNYDTFDRIRKAMKRQLGMMETDDPDLSRLKRCGAKLLLSHAIADDTIPADGTIDYYTRVLDTMGGEERTDGFFRCFITPGGGHTDLVSPGLSTTLSDGMIALMRWVEEGVAPEELPGLTWDFDQNREVLHGTVLRYHPRKVDVVKDIEHNPDYAVKAAGSTTRYGGESVISDLLSDEATAAITKAYLGQLLENPAMAQAKSLSLAQLRNMLPVESIKTLVTKLIEALEALG